MIPLKEMVGCLFRSRGLSGKTLYILIKGEIYGRAYGTKVPFPASPETVQVAKENYMLVPKELL